MEVWLSQLGKRVYKVLNALELQSPNPSNVIPILQVRGIRVEKLNM